MILEKRTTIPGRAVGREKRPHQHLYKRNVRVNRGLIAMLSRQEFANRPTMTAGTSGNIPGCPEKPVRRNHAGRADGGTEPFHPIILHGRSGWEVEPLSAARKCGLVGLAVFY